MKKFVSESWLVVMLGVVFAALLAGTQTGLMPLIEKNEKAEVQQAIVEVVPAMDPESKPEELDDIAGCKVWRCVSEDGALAGWAVKAEGNGFIDKIYVIVGLSADGSTITGIKVVKDSETPGLGNKIQTKGNANPYPLQYAGRTTQQPLTLVKEGMRTNDTQIEAITAATYSSQYTLDIVNEVVAKVVPELPKK